MDATLGATLPQFDQAVRISGAIPIREWTFQDSGYAVIDDPTHRVLEALASDAPVNVVQAARLEVSSTLLGESGGIERLLPETLRHPIGFPGQATLTPMLSIPPQDPPLVICSCKRGIHEPPPCHR